MPVDDQRAHAAPTKLIGEHQPGRAGPDDQDISIHSNPVRHAIEQSKGMTA